VRTGGGWREQGSASLLVVGFGAAVVVLALGVMAAGEVIVARHRARNAADAGALAGAMRVGDGDSAACAVAARLVVENRGRLTGCVVAGATVTVTAEVRVGVAMSSQRARAGPVGST